MTEQLNFDDADEDPFRDDPADATHVMLNAITLVDFLRRGDRYGMTLWDALEEAIRWWTTEHHAITIGAPDLTLEGPQLGDADPLRCTLQHLLDRTNSGDEPVHISLALQQALRHWTETVARTGS